ncbi:hypothetical protein H310_15028, partial [Aphanomyces invadans]
SSWWVHDGGYSLSYNGGRRTGPVYVTFTTDKLNATRPPSSSVDPTIPKECHQFTVNSYASVRAGYDRGYLARKSYDMINIAPQVTSFSQCIWVNMEDIEACYRNLNRIWSWGGIVYTDVANDYFFESHGISTPD